jgi:hypothetical protein
MLACSPGRVVVNFVRDSVGIAAWNYEVPIIRVLEVFVHMMNSS